MQTCQEPTCLVTVEGLTKKFGSRTAVDGIDFSVQEGELFGLLGPNGAGKSTTMSMLSTLLAPDGGRIHLCGLDLEHQSPEARRLIGFVPQELALYPTLSARDNLAFFGRIYGLSGGELNDRIGAALELTRLEDRAKEPVKNFSGGMKRRLNIAVSLIHRPRLIFLDEPTVGVDPQSRIFILEHVERLKQECITVVYTTHYMEEASRLCDRVAIMDQGRILALDTPAGLLKLLGGGVVYVGLSGDDHPLSEIRNLGSVREADVQGDRIKIDAHDARQVLIDMMQVCKDRRCGIRSLEVLEPNLENVFLHLTGKRLRN